MSYQNERRLSPAEFPLADGVVLKRIDGDTWTNVKQAAIYHSPTDFDWGYAGSAPADLALNILEAVLLREGYEGGRIKVWKHYTCFQVAWFMHQAFKEAYIAVLPTEGGIIPYQEIVSWMGDKMQNIHEVQA